MYTVISYTNCHMCTRHSSGNCVAIDALNASRVSSVVLLLFFFQAEDGIRDYKVTGVQTCALPIFWNNGNLAIVANVGPLGEPLTRTTYQNGTGRKPLQLFSHSDQVGLWQSSIANNASQTGWGGRTADKTGALNGPASFPQVVTIAGISLFVTGVNARPL